MSKTFVNNAVFQGKLTKKPCSFCGKEKVQAHHYDYSKPLDVIWLCVRCHKKLHKLIPLHLTSSLTSLLDEIEKEMPLKKRYAKNSCPDWYERNIVLNSEDGYNQALKDFASFIKKEREEINKHND